MEMRWRYIMLYLVVVLSYVIVTLTSPTPGNTYDLSRFGLSLFQMSVVLPVILIWYVGVQAATSLKRYVSTLQATKERAGLRILANGLVVLVTGLILITLVGTVRPYAISNDWIEPYRIAYNYLSVLFPLVGMYLIYRGSARLVEDTGTTSVTNTKRAVLILVLTCTFAGLVALLFTNSYRTTTPDPAKYQSYYLSDPLIIGTIFIPYLMVWLFGGLAAFNVRSYSQSVRTHQSAFQKISTGILTIIGSLIFLQLLGVLSPSLASLGLAPLLLLIYVLLLVYGMGYFLIGSGARRLQRTRERTPV